MSSWVSSRSWQDTEGPLSCLVLLHRGDLVQEFVTEVEPGLRGPTRGVEALRDQQKWKAIRIP